MEREEEGEAIAEAAMLDEAGEGEGEGEAFGLVRRKRVLLWIEVCGWKRLSK